MKAIHAILQKLFPDHDFLIVMKKRDIGSGFIVSGNSGSNQIAANLTEDEALYCCANMVIKKKLVGYMKMISTIDKMKEHDKYSKMYDKEHETWYAE